MNSLSVVIPTKDRAEALARTLDALEAQRADGATLEAIVIDNGSSDGTVEQVRRRTGDSTLAIRLLEQPDGGPAAARNAGVKASTGELLLFLGDDTEPADETLLRTHLDLHAARPESTYGVLGRITWTARKPITPFMHWLENGGPQFAYSALEPGSVDAASHFYSSHASLKRTIFEQDRRVVESQRPERVPFDLAAEMHLKFDAVAINYRRAMREQGLARRTRPHSAPHGEGPDLPTQPGANS